MTTLPTSDTICARATPPGIAGLAVIRLSGPDAIAIADRHINGRVSPNEAMARTVHQGWWMDGDVRIDEITYVVFTAPKSYTGEHVVEVSCHGGYFVTEQILTSLIGDGARLAEPGEFTKRAFMNGKMDLTQVEAVADILHAESRVGARTAAKQLAGGFTRRLTETREKLIGVLGLLELELDFSEEDVEFVDRTHLRNSVQEIINASINLAGTASSAEVLRSGFTCAVVGFPNAGKSSLFNALLSRERAIVSDVEGTTRDYIEETIHLHGFSVRLIDTAGLRTSSDAIEVQGMVLTRSIIEQANLVLIVNDVSQGLHASASLVDELRRQVGPFDAVVVQNKSDLLQSELSDVGTNDLLVSAKTGSGIDELRDLLYDRVKVSAEGISDVLVNARQAQLLQQLVVCLRSVITGMDEGLSSDYLAVDLRAALRILGDVTGEVWDPDVLEHVFSRFCIGK